MKYDPQEELDALFGAWLKDKRTIRELLNDVYDAGWDAGASHAVDDHWSEDDLMEHLDEREREAGRDVPDGGASHREVDALMDAVNADDAHQAWLDEQSKLCGAHYVTGGADPYGTDCDQPAGHYPKTKHEGPDPLGGDGRVRWNGGGSCAGDPLPYRDVEWVEPRVAQRTVSV